MERNNTLGKIGGLDNDLNIEDGASDPHKISHAEAEKIAQRLDEAHDGIGYSHKPWNGGKVTRQNVDVRGKQTGEPGK